MILVSGGGVCQCHSHRCSHSLHQVRHCELWAGAQLLSEWLRTAWVGLSVISSCDKRCAARVSNCLSVGLMEIKCKLHTLKYFKHFKRFTKIHSVKITKSVANFFLLMTTHSTRMAVWKKFIWNIRIISDLRAENNKYSLLLFGDSATLCHSDDCSVFPGKTNNKSYVTLQEFSFQWSSKLQFCNFTTFEVYTKIQN